MDGMYVIIITIVIHLLERYSAIASEALAEHVR